VLQDGFEWGGTAYPSLSAIARVSRDNLDKKDGGSQSVKAAAGSEGMILLSLRFGKHFSWAALLIVAERQSAFSLIVARVGGRPGPRLRSSAARRR
jgi:hypothetical protein